MRSNQNLLLVLAFTASAATSGCLFSSDKSTPAAQPARDMGPAWTLSYLAKADTAPEQSVAYYGFSVSADGAYQVGPGPQGQTQQGNISGDELAALNATLSPELNNSNLTASSAELCESLDVDQGEETVTLTRHHQDAVLVHQSGTNFCYRATSQDQAGAVQNAIETLAEKYYALPFPDVCADASASVEALYPSVEACSTDNDCFYIDKDFQVIPPSSMQYVYTDNCSRVKPLIAANAATILTNQAALTTALNHARDICGYRMVRDDCTGITGFNSTQAPPVCQRGVCQVNPAISQ